MVLRSSFDLSEIKEVGGNAEWPRERNFWQVRSWLEEVGRSDPNPEQRNEGT